MGVFVCMCVWGLCFCVYGVCVQGQIFKKTALQKMLQESILDCSRGHFWPGAPRGRFGESKCQKTYVFVTICFSGYGKHAKTCVFEQPRWPRGSFGLLGAHWGGQKCVKMRGLGPPQGRPKWPRDPLGPMGRTGVAKNAAKYEVWGHPRGGQGGQGTPWGPWAQLGLPKMHKNTRFWATPGAAKVAKGPLGAHGPNWGSQKCVKMRGFGPPQRRPRWLRDPLGPMGRTGVAKNA